MVQKLRLWFSGRIRVGQDIKEREKYVQQIMAALLDELIKKVDTNFDPVTTMIAPHIAVQETSIIFDCWVWCRPEHCSRILRLLQERVFTQPQNRAYFVALDLTIGKTTIKLVKPSP